MTDDKIDFAEMESRIQTELAVKQDLRDALEATTEEILNAACIDTHYDNLVAGWWDGLEDNPLAIPTKLMLVVTELAEATEGDRRSLQDDHLPHRTMLETELADAVIRIFDIAGRLQVPLGTVIREKKEYNRQRADHKPENRKKSGGKKY